MALLQESLFDISAYLSKDTIRLLIRIAIFLAISFPILFTLRGWAHKYFEKKYSSHYSMLAGKLILYVGLTLIVVTVMGQLGISLAPLLGAAGIVGVAIGFASQTSVSNIISGLFLIAEGPFKVDDIITVKNTTGVVLSIDILSVKLRTFNNQFVRIPNETLIKTEVTNITRFPIRRLSTTISVAHKENIGEVRDILMEVAEKNEYALLEPEPVITFDTIQPSSIDLVFKVWAQVAEYISLKNTIHEEIKVAFDEAGVEIPFPHISLYAGEATNPLPVRLEGESFKSDK